ncbi:tol-pal system YbgF family protein [Gemmatimonadota bacterium]
MRDPETTRSITLITPFLLITLLLSPGCGSSDWETRWEETLTGTQSTAEEMIVRIEEFLAEEPPLKYASEARFTLGFTWAESLKKYDEARRWFEELLEEDPGCDWADDAEWMLENMEKEMDEILPLLDWKEPPPR